MRILPKAVQCPSVSTGAILDHEDCSAKRCPWWKDGCGARRITEEEFQEKFTSKLAATCPLASRCRWHLEAVAEGKPGCAVRRLGMLCEHQGGEWNTFEMADPHDWEDDQFDIERATGCVS